MMLFDVDSEELTAGDIALAWLCVLLGVCLGTEPW